MGNIATDFEAHAALLGEAITHAVIGAHDGDKSFNDAPLNRVLPWSEARPFLDYDYDSGFGGADCHPVYAWTETRVIFVSEYDGATNPASVPRSPQDLEPGFQ